MTPDAVDPHGGAPAADDCPRARESSSSAVAGGGAVPPWVVDGCSCWDAECAIHGQEVVPQVVTPSEVGQLRIALRTLVEKWRERERALCRQADGQNGTMCGALLAYRADGIGACADQLAALLAVDVRQETEQKEEDARVERKADAGR